MARFHGGVPVVALALLLLCVSGAGAGDGYDGVLGCDRAIKKAGDAILDYTAGGWRRCVKMHRACHKRCQAGELSEEACLQCLQGAKSRCVGQVRVAMPAASRGFSHARTQGCDSSPVTCEDLQAACATSKGACASAAVEYGAWALTCKLEPLCDLLF